MGSKQDEHSLILNIFFPLCVPRPQIGLLVLSWLLNSLIAQCLCLEIKNRVKANVVAVV